MGCVGMWGLSRGLQRGMVCGCWKGGKGGWEDGRGVSRGVQTSSSPKGLESADDTSRMPSVTTMTRKSISGVRTES